MSGGALAVGKNAKAVNKVEQSPVLSDLIHALTALRNGLNGVNLSDKGREVVNKKLDKLDESFKSNTPQVALTVLDELNDNLEMANINIAHIPILSEPFTQLKTWASGARSGDDNPKK
jgi:hypothetical protein